MEKFERWYECQILHNTHPINSAPSPDLLANLKLSMHITHSVCTGPHHTSTYAYDSSYEPQLPSKDGKARILWVARYSPPTYEYRPAVTRSMLMDTHTDPQRTVIAVHGEYTVAVAHMAQWSMRFGEMGFHLYTMPRHTIRTWSTDTYRTHQAPVHIYVVQNAWATQHWPIYHAELLYRWGFPSFFLFSIFPFYFFGLLSLCELSDRALARTN